MKETTNYTKKTSRRLDIDRNIRSIWSDIDNCWYFSVLDVISVIRHEPSYQKCRNYWKYLKKKLMKNNPQLVSGTTQLKLKAPDGKYRLTDVLLINCSNL